MKGNRITGTTGRNTMKDEFIRKKQEGKRNHSFLFDLLNWALPCLAVAIGLEISTQLFAASMKYDTRIMGPSLFVIRGREFYNPFLYLLCYAKYMLRPDFTPYLQASQPPMLAGVITAVIMIVIFGILREVVKRNENIHGTARWGKVKDLRKNGLTQESGVILGQLFKADIRADKSSTALVLRQRKPALLICHNGKLNTLLLAPTGSGKGVSVIIPTQLSYPGSMIIFDPKGENYQITAGFRKQFSHVIRFSPVSKETIRFNPVMAIKGGATAFRDANLISDILFQSATTQQSGNEEFFNNSAKDMVTISLLHLRFSDTRNKNFYGLLKILSEISAGDEESVAGKALWESMIEAEHYYFDGEGKKVIDRDIHDIIKRGAMRQLAKNPKEQASVFSTVFAKLQLFDDPLIANATAESDFDLADFINSKEPISLYLTVPYSDIDRISAVFRLLITFILKQFSDGETRHGSVKLKNHLLILLDEFPVLGCFPYIEQVMGVLRGYGINFLIVCQSLSQLVKIYGEHHAFLDHCVVKTIFQPGKIEDAEKFSREIGKQTVSQENISRSGKRFGVSMSNVNISDNVTGNNLINADELMKLDANECVIMAHGMPPYIGKKVVYYQDGRFAEKTKLEAPENLEEMRKEIRDLPSNVKNRAKKFIAEGIIESPGGDEAALFDDDIEEWLSASAPKPKEKPVSAAEEESYGGEAEGTEGVEGVLSYLDEDV
jgi:type IV secretion system protein VirD4